MTLSMDTCPLKPSGLYVEYEREKKKQQNIGDQVVMVARKS
jgi:hypothetical protein